jgi:two-component system, NtrC family, sensor kinase
MMPYRSIIILLLFVFFVSVNSFSQTPRADSLLRVIESSMDDSLKVRAYLDLGQEFLSSDISQAIHYLDDAILIALKIDYKKGLQMHTIYKEGHWPIRAIFRMQFLFSDNP